MQVPITLQGAAKGLPGGKDTWKMAFSGDCRPCASVVAAAKDADLLIHEVGVLFCCVIPTASIQTWVPWRAQP